MNFHEIAAGCVLSSYGKDDDVTYALENMSEAACGEAELDEDIIFWEPFQNWPVDDVLSVIDDFAREFERVYNQGASDGAQEILKSINQ